MALLTLSWWPLLSPWLSPAAAWFIFFNAVVGAIAVMSTSGAQAGQAGGGAEATPSSRRRLCRSGSSMVLDRLRSFFIFPMGQLPIDESSAALGSYCCSPEAEAASATQACAPERSPQALAATTTGGTAAIRAAQPSAPVAMATAEDHAPPALPMEEEEEEEDKAETETEAEKEQDHDESISLDEAYALAQRHCAQSPASPPPAAAASATAAPAALPTEHKKKPAKVVADWRRVSKAGEALEGKAELNARAELFIRQFREDLRLQRLNSILKHTHALGSPTAAR
ncbi:unnamed protein product [Miscanthus lutarioriparius]|uniref:DUF4408 domain-containing protein n=1 Tax=Miscanthus lutarioriparius TaxID=422564 RepID=A0A811PHH1_9POAL|nr:unnamed protein product [Miscanthus lutarioriparius]